MSRIQILLLRLRRRRSEIAALSRDNRTMAANYEKLRAEKERMETRYQSLFHYEVTATYEPRPELWRCQVTMTKQAAKRIRDIKLLIQDVATQLCKNIQL